MVLNVKSKLPLLITIWNIVYSVFFIDPNASYLLIVIARTTIENKHDIVIVRVAIVGGVLFWLWANLDFKLN